MSLIGIQEKFKYADVSPPENEIVAETNVDCPYLLWEQLGVTSCNFEDFVDVYGEVEAVLELTYVEIFQFISKRETNSDEEATATPMEQLTSVQSSLDIIFKLKEIILVASSALAKTCLNV